MMTSDDTDPEGLDQTVQIIKVCLVLISSMKYMAKKLLWDFLKEHFLSPIIPNANIPNKNICAAMRRGKC